MPEKDWWIFRDRKSSQDAAGSSVWRPELFQMAKELSERVSNSSKTRISEAAGPAKEALRKPKLNVAEVYLNEMSKRAQRKSPIKGA